MASKTSGAPSLSSQLGALSVWGRLGGLIKLAAFFGALKLAVACICVLHIADRFRSLSRGQANSEILEAALILIVAISIVSVGPASFRDGAELIRDTLCRFCLPRLRPGCASSNAAMRSGPKAPR